MKLLFILFLFLIFASCEKNNKNDRSNTDTTNVSDSTKSDSSLSIENQEHAPSWFKSLPKKEGYIYATGTAASRRANIASDKALLYAQIRLAEKLKKLRLDSGIREGEKAIGADSDPGSDNLSITMQDVMTKNKKQVKSGDLWYSYVLLELKLDK